MRDVVIVVEIVGQGEPRHVGQFRRDDFGRGLFAAQQLPADFGEFQIRLAGDDVIGQRDDGLRLPFVTHLRPAEDDRRLWRHAADGGHDLQRFRHVPDVDAEADDARRAGQQHLGDVERALVDVELDEARARLERAEIRHQVTQAERRVNVLGVERGEDDVGHGGGE